MDQLSTINLTQFKTMSWWHLDNRYDWINWRTSNNTYLEPGLPRVNTVLIAAARPESGPSTNPFRPSNWSQISSFFPVSYLYVTQWQFPVCLRPPWVVRLCPSVLLESEVKQDSHVKSDRSWCQCVSVCVFVDVSEFSVNVERGLQESCWGRSIRARTCFSNLPLMAPCGEGVTWGNHCIGSFWLLPIPTGSHTNVLDTSGFWSSIGTNFWPLKSPPCFTWTRKTFSLLTSCSVWLSERLSPTSSN